MISSIFTRLVLPLIVYSAVCTTAAEFVSLPRWGQTTAVINNHLFLHGGKTDQFNSFSYTAAYTNNDLLHLDLSQSFDPSSPPWQYIAGSENSSTPQGPILAWHSLSAYNTSQLLLFGGDGGPNSPVVLPDRADSASLLDVSETLLPQFISENPSWSGEPLRRIHHSVSSMSGKLWITGGEKDDGSSLGFSDHYVFDPETPAFTQLPSENGPPDLYGHSSVILSDGRLLVFGGYSQSQSQLLPLSTVWSMDTTQQTLSWSMLPVLDSSLPTPRRAFTTVLLENDQILIHGGADSVLQTSYSDGWILDTSKNPMIWSSVSELTQLGPRRDHFAVAVGSQVVFGFGYAQNAAAPASLSVFDTKNLVFLSSFTPSATPAQTTLPIPSGTGSAGGGQGSGMSSGSSSGNKGNGNKSGTSQGVSPSSSGSTSPNSPNNVNGSGDNDGHKPSHALPAAVGTVFGCLVLLIIVLFLYYRHRRHLPSQRFRRIGNDETGDAPGQSEKLELAGSGWFQHGPGRNWNFWTTDTRNTRRDVYTNTAKRFDILADEDERHFDVHSFSMFRDGSGSSRSFYSGLGQSQRSVSGGKSQLDDIINGSLSSLRNIGVAIGKQVRKVSVGKVNDDTGNIRSGDWWEKEDPLVDPFSDDAALLHSEGNGNVDGINYRSYPDNDEPGAAAIARGVFQNEGSSQYNDPFADRDSIEAGTHIKSLEPTIHEGKAGTSFGVNNYEVSGASQSSYLATVSSHDTETDHAASSHDSSAIKTSNSFYDNKGSSSESAVDRSSLSTRPRTSSLIGASTVPVQQQHLQSVKRSDSWWTKLKRTSFRDVASHEPVVRTQMEFRDPNPAPRLISIREASNSLSPASPEVSESNRRNRSEGSNGGMYSPGGHERSMSSLRTAKTADSEAIEKMAARVDVVQRAGTVGSHQSYPSSDSAYARHALRSLGQQMTDISAPDSLRSSFVSDNFDLGDHRPLVESPVPEEDVFGRIIGLSRHDNNSRSVAYPESVARRATRGIVAPRVAEIEQRISLDSLTKADSPIRSQPRSGDQRSYSRAGGNSVSYGLVQRAELVIANPDRKTDHDSSSQS